MRCGSGIFCELSCVENTGRHKAFGGLFLSSNCPLLIHKWSFLLVYTFPIKWDIITIKWEEVADENIILHSSRWHMLIGEHNHTIDDKGRTSLPAKFRKEMGAKVVIAPGIDNNCLSVFTMKEWKGFTERLSRGNPQSVLQADNRNFNRLIIGRAVEVEVDSSGRMLVPENLREHAGLSAKVVIIGVVNRVEMWDAKAWDAFRTEYSKKTEALAEKLGSVGIM